MKQVKKLSPSRFCNEMLLPDFIVCGVRFDEHSGIKHLFRQNPPYKFHIPLSGIDHTHCGWRIVDVSETIHNGSERIVKRVVRDNTVCLSCLKTWLYFKERVKFYA